jgi:ribonuclease BN (tRNA processing enzyme)
LTAHFTSDLETATDLGLQTQLIYHQLAASSFPHPTLAPDCMILPMKRLMLFLLLSAGLLLPTSGQPAPAPESKSATTPHISEVVVLGSGTPNADPDRSGPAVAIIVNGHSYLVDCGPGIVRRAAAATRQGVPGLEMKNLTTLFITHLHSDHTLGYPDLTFSPWVLGRTEHLTVYGPRGTADMTKNILAAWKKDIEVRTQGLEHANTTGYQVDAHEIEPGVVYKDENVTVTAFPVKHGSWDESFGYRFQTPDRVIVISGDTSPADSVVKACNGCDVLLHEVYASGAHSEMDSPQWQAYFKAFHTSTTELAAIATRAKPKLLVLYHQMFHGVSEGEMLQLMRNHYAGAVVSAHDLDVY